MSATARLLLHDVPSPPSRAVTVGSWRNSVEWDHFVTANADASFYHLSAWRDVMREVLGLKTWYRVARDGRDDCAGVLPLVYVTAPLDHYLISMPFLNAGGPLGSAATRTTLIRDAVAEARSARVTLMELRCRTAPGGDLPVTPRKITVRMDLPVVSGALWESFPAKLRSQIRRAERADLTVSHGADLWEDFYTVFQRHMHELGTPALPREWFRALVDCFASSVEVVVVYHGAAPVAAGFGFLWHDEMEIVWASSLRAYSTAAPNMLLYWSFMQRAIERGARVFDFGRCSVGSGTHRFKQQWGGRDVQLPWVQSRFGRVSAGVPSTNGGVFKLGASIWRRLPLRVAAALGPTVARWLP